MSKQVALLDFCTSDYFSGYHKPVIAVPVYNKMTQGEIGDAILQELNATWEHLEQGYTKDELIGKTFKNKEF